MRPVLHALLSGLFCVLYLGHGAAWAQATSSDRSSNISEALRDLDQQNNESRARMGVALSEAEKVVKQVTDAVVRRDCVGAVAALNIGLSKGMPEVITLAGAMYEEGLCVKPNWDRAVSLYQRAANAGHPGVAARLAAGYASASGGRDKAAALWWAVRAKTALPTACTPAASVDDPDRFVAALQAWPAGRLDACAYTAAVMANIQAEAEGEGPSLASSFGLVGKIRVVFVPEKGSLDIVDELSEGANTGNLSADGVAIQAERRNARRNFVSGLRLRADNGFKRFDKPSALPAEWRAEAAHDIRPATAVR